MSKCQACPFNDGITEEATQGQNYGCLPTASEMIERLETTGEALSCHDVLDKACRGLCAVRPNASKAKVKPYSEWYGG